VSRGAPRGAEAPASIPPRRYPGIDPAWSRLVTAVDADGRERTWHVLDTGRPSDGTDGGTLLCVHGNPTWSYLWRDLLASAPPGWRVVAIDHLDMGFSERTRTLRSLARRVEDLDVVVKTLQLDGPIVPVAHDWGGPIALGWSLRHHSRLGGIVLTNTAVHQPEGATAPSLIRAARTPGVLDNVCVRTPTFLRGALALAQPSLSDDVRDAYLAPYLTPDRRHAIGAFVRDIPLEPDHRSAGTLDAIVAGLQTLTDVPVLLVWGAKDPVFSDLYLHDLQDRLPHAQVQRVAGASHLAPEDVDLPAIVTRWVAGLGADEGLSPVDGTAPGAFDLDAATDRVPLWAALEDPELEGRPAIVEVADRPDGEPTIVTFDRLAANVVSLAAALADRGVRPGDRVALLVEPGVDLATCLYACWRLGAVVVIADAGLGARGITHALQSAAPDHLIAIPKALAAARALRWPGRPIAVGDLSPTALKAAGADTTLARLIEAGASLPPPAEPGPDDEAAVVFTSGATGPSKGVVYRHRQIEAQRDALRRTYDITPDDRLVAAFAPFALFGPLLGITSVVPDMDVTSPGTLRASALAQAAVAIDATLVFASPAALVSVLTGAGELSTAQRDPLSRVRLLLSAGAPVPAELLRAFGSLLPNAEPHTPYGMTEALPVADISLAEIEAAGTGNGVCVGHPVSGVEVAISPLDDEGAATGALTRRAEVTGEVCVRAAHVKDRYDRLWATEAASSRDRGWHRSGDVGHLDADGRLWIEGRLIHIITTAAGVVTPVAIERRVETLAGVAMAAAVGVGPEGTQQVVVVIAPSDGARHRGLASQQLTDTVRNVVNVEVAAVLQAPSLPVDIRHNSKIDRAAIADWAENVLAGARPPKL
jgi:olefin beta-lactone synthetase